MFYFDEKIGNYEKYFQWDLALAYLENKYANAPNEETLNSLIGFSWFYILEGPVESRKFERDECKLGLKLWKKYIDIGLKDFQSSANFNFIAGYTLNLSGVLIDKNFDCNYESLGINLIHKCFELSNETTLTKLSSHFIRMQNTTRYKQLIIKKEDLIKVFGDQSLLGKYFCEMYSNNR